MLDDIQTGCTFRPYEVRLSVGVTWIQTLELAFWFLMQPIMFPLLFLWARFRNDGEPHGPPAIFIKNRSQAAPDA